MVHSVYKGLSNDSLWDNYRRSALFLCSVCTGEQCTRVEMCICAQYRAISGTSLGFVQIRLDVDKTSAGGTTQWTEIRNIFWGGHGPLTRLQMWRSSNSNLTTFKLRTFSTDSKFDECFKHFVVNSNANSWKNPRSSTYFICTDSERVQINLFFFLRFDLSLKLQLLNVQYNFCSVMCYTVQIWTLIYWLVTLGNNILLQSC